MFPESLPKSYIPYITKAITKSIKRVSAIITPSESIKIDIIEHFKNINENKIFV